MPKPCAQTAPAYTLEQLQKSVPSSFHVLFAKTIDSTNTYMKDHARHLPDHSVLFARTQSAGRGRNGHSFYSPPDTGLYFSILLHTENKDDLNLLSALSAVAICLGIEKVCRLEPKIKWVNDIFISNRKVAGILCETVLDSQGRKSIVVGMGVNVNTCHFPGPLEEIAGSLKTESKEAFSLPELAGAILGHFDHLIQLADPHRLITLYKARSLMLHKKIQVFLPDRRIEGIVEDINPDGSLLIENGDKKISLYAGEIQFCETESGEEESGSRNRAISSSI